MPSNEFEGKSEPNLLKQVRLTIRFSGFGSGSLRIHSLASRQSASADLAPLACEFHSLAHW
jgi:hypothetical protein